MKFQAPTSVTALFCADEAIAPDENGRFDAVETLAGELAAHGCVPYVEPAAMEKSRSRGNRIRVEKAS
jgi:hypothetical protein